jgi:SAM-dependent methyltransferase
MTSQGSREYLRANRALWDEWTTIHERSADYNLAGFKAGGHRLRPYELAEIGDVTGRDLLHLQCNFGIDTLSWARLGARVTGVDYSEVAIALARSLAAELELDARFIRSDLLDLPTVLADRFDLVYTSRGVLAWLPDLSAWAWVIAHFLRPGGTFYITEEHSFLHVFADGSELRVGNNYFPGPEPGAWPVVGSYADPSAPVEQSVGYSWGHTLGEIVTVLAAAGLHIAFLHEFPFAEWAYPFLVAHDEGTWRTWRLPADQEAKIPLFFSLKAIKLPP